MFLTRFGILWPGTTRNRVWFSSLRATILTLNLFLSTKQVYDSHNCLSSMENIQSSDKKLRKTGELSISRYEEEIAL